MTYRRTNTDETPGTYPGVIVADYTANDNYDVAVKNGNFTIETRERGVYEVTSGAGGTWTKDSGKTLGFKAERTVDPEKAFGHFTGIEVDGKAVPEKDSSGRVNWTAKSGSVVVELQPSYLETLSVGKHVLSVLFDDGNSASAEFSVTAKYSPSPGSGGGFSPKTGDSLTGLVVPIEIIAVCALFLALFSYSRRRHRDRADDGESTKR